MLGREGFVSPGGVAGVEPGVLPRRGDCAGQLQMSHDVYLSFCPVLPVAVTVTGSTGSLDL